MALRKPKSALAMDQIWQRLMQVARKKKSDQKHISIAFNDMLDDLLEDPNFGVGFTDPREISRKGLK